MQYCTENFCKKFNYFYPLLYKYHRLYNEAYTSLSHIINILSNTARISLCFVNSISVDNNIY